MMNRFAAAAVAASLGVLALNPAPAKADDPYWQCVTFARMFSGINIFGDAWTWWNQAVSKFRTGRAPETGSVLVFQPHGRMSRGHVAVVSDILTDRVIRVTHAHWGGSRCKVQGNGTVVRGKGLVPPVPRSGHHGPSDLRLRLQRRPRRLRERPSDRRQRHGGKPGRRRALIHVGRPGVRPLRQFS